MNTLRKRVRQLGITPGIFPVGKWNAITDVAGIKVGHFTLIKGNDIRTGVTAILPHAFKTKFLRELWLAIASGN